MDSSRSDRPMARVDEGSHLLISPLRSPHLTLFILNKETKHHIHTKTFFQTKLLVARSLYDDRVSR